MKKIFRKTLMAAAMAALFTGSIAMAQSAPKLPPPKLPAPKASPGAGVPAPGAQSGDTAAPRVPPPPVTIKAALEQAEVGRGENLAMTITLTFLESVRAPAPPLIFEFPDPPKAEGLVLVGNSYTAEKEFKSNVVQVKRVYTYEFRAEQEGETEIGPVKVVYYRAGSEEREERETQPLPALVTKPPLRLSRVFKHPAALVVLAFIALAATVGLAWPRLRARKIEETSQAPVKTPHELARERLKEIDRLRMGGEYQAFFQALSAEVRRYLGDVMGMKIGPSSKPARAVEPLGQEWPDRMRDLERLSDQVKFAGKIPTADEMDLAMNTALRLVREGERRDAGAPAPGLRETTE